MAKPVEPQVFILAETKIVPAVGEGEFNGVQDFLHFLGVPDWQTDAKTGTEKLIEMAGKLCYMSFSTDLNKNLTKVGARNNWDYIQQGLIGTKHGSVLEHASVTLAFMNVSRVFTHELVRHRVGAAYSQVSGRYVRTDEINYFLPSIIAENKGAKDVFQVCFERMEQWINTLEFVFQIGDMKDFTLKKKLTSAFRRIIGNGQANHIIATFNHRTLRHIIEMRTSRHAEEEIRLAMWKAFQLVHDRYPSIYADADLVEVDGIPEVTFKSSKV